MKKTVVIGASSNPERYAYLATQKLKKYGHEVVAVGIKPGMIGDTEIETGRPEIPDVDTVTLYVGPQNQPAWYDYIFSLNPKRIVFNPGTENPELEKMAADKGIEPLEACTLVMLSLDNY
jgi:predicted CoA-binding protein